MKGRHKHVNHKMYNSFCLKVFGILWLAALNAALVILPGYLLSKPVAAWLGRADSLWIHLSVSLCWNMVILTLVITALDHIRNRVSPDRRHHRPNIFYEVLSALDRIASGDYNIQVRPVDQWGVDHYGELVDKINELARDLSSMERMRQEFVSNVSHEIQSPLTSISGFAVLLKDELPREQRQHYVEVIEAESKRLSHLSDNLLRLSLVDAEEPVLNRQPFRLDRQIQEILLMLEPQWAEKKIELTIELDRISYSGDRELLSQVWINLLHNSIKFTPQSGGIGVSLKKVEDRVVCVVSDTGCGIPEEDLPRVFERFYKVDKARDRSKGGSGLGLSLVKKIVELHGGSLSVRSVVGEGSEFTAALPFSER